MIIKKKDFIELEFTGKIKESNQIFDTTSEENAKKLGLKNAKPIKICVGEGMLVKGFDEALEGKEINQLYSVELKPEKAFGARKQNLVKLIPLSVFLEQKINPYPGLTLNMDGIIARISSVSGGRVLTDFNLPLSGKTVIYDFKIKKIIESAGDKAKALAEFFTGEEPEVKIEGKKAVFFFKKKIDNKNFAKIAKDILDLDAEIKEKK